MSKRKKIVIICAGCIAIVAIISLLCALLMNFRMPKTYSTSKIVCEKILAKHQTQMEELSIDALKTEMNGSAEFLDYHYMWFPDKGIVKFYIDGQGMLGGQYWDLVYSSDGTLYGQTEKYIYEETGGNNIIMAERLNEYWWFLWTDYDGTDESHQ